MHTTSVRERRVVHTNNLFWVMEMHSISDYVNVCVGMSARTGDSTKNRHNQMAESSNANSTLGDAGRKQSPVSGVSGLASSTVRGAL